MTDAARRPRHLRALAAATCLLACAAAQTPKPTGAPPEVALFQRASTTEQERLLAALRAELDQLGDPFLAACRHISDAAVIGGSDRQERFAAHHGKRVHAADEAADTQLPQTVQYVFGVGCIDPLDVHGVSPVKKLDKGAVERLTTEGNKARRAAVFHQLLLGLPPDADRLLAALLQDLDQDTGGDRFAAFLHAWRNGPESFYEALDRTAGTKDSVFFYDAMLGDFRTTFVGNEPGAAALRSLQGAHDALHEAFLSYRQYRGFREAVAWSLVLPPTAPLPARLARYEAAVPGGYSLRQQVTMVLASKAHDPRQVTELVASHAAPLPKPIWSASYDPYPRWNEQFAALLPAMIDAAGSSDAFLAQAVAARRTLAERLTQAARKAVGNSGGETGADGKRR